MSNKWTEDQLKAINTDHCDLLVAAAAGSGKTAVLVQRIISKVTSRENPIDIDNLLVVTFTNAAAAEMRERIGEAITKELDQNPDSRQLLRQMTLLQKASITTVHSFCLDVIRNNFHIIHIDPNFRIGDETEGMLLRREAMDELLEERYDAGNEAFLALAEAYGGTKGDAALEELVAKLYSFSESSPWPEKWLHASAENFHIHKDFQFGESKWAKVLLDNIKIELNGYAALLSRAVRIILAYPELSPYLEQFCAERDQLLVLLQDRELTWDGLSARLELIEFGRLKAVKNAPEEDKKVATELRRNVKDGIKKIKNTMAGTAGEGLNLELMDLYPFMAELSSLVVDYRRIYGEKKRERGIIDFNDIEHFALEILTSTDENGQLIPSETALTYRNRFSEVMVDEYQDSNLVQEVLLAMISKSGEEEQDQVRNRFMVGDVKQSIYRFRQAMPELFLGKYNRYQEGTGSERKITLYKNFRSRSEILKAVNHVFQQIMSESIGELEYTEREFLNPGAAYGELQEKGRCGGPVELHIIESRRLQSDSGTEKNDSTSAESFDAPDTSIPDEANIVDIKLQIAADANAEVDAKDGTIAEEEADEEELDSIQLEARYVAGEIRSLVSSGLEEPFYIYDKAQGRYRRVEYRDIVILLRATKNWSDGFMEELSKAGIPAFSDSGTGYFQTIEIKTILSLLEIVDNPFQDIPLLAVLRSPLFFLSPEELIDIRLGRENISFYEAMAGYAAEQLDALSLKLRNIIDRLRYFRELAVYTPVDEFIWKLYEETGYLSYVGAMPGGALRQANLKVLFQRARQFEQTSYKGLFHFIHFINKLKQSSGDMGSAKILGENENVVRLMSIHKSKGLEFPVVFVSGAGKGFNLMDLNGTVLVHNDLGFGPDYVNLERRYAYPSTIKEAIKAKMRLETLSEEMRVLYVAFTRAKEKLIITGCVKNLEKAVSKWENASELVDGKLSQYEVATSRCYLDWIGPAVINHAEGKTQLQKLLQQNDVVLEAESWEIHFAGRSDILIAAGDEDSEMEESEGEQDVMEQQKLMEELDRRLNFVYRYQSSYSIPSKLSVSEIKRKHQKELVDEDAVQLYKEIEFRKPAFLAGEEKLSGAQKGTIMHLVMQHLDFGREPTKESIRGQISHMIEQQLLTEKEAASVSLNKILAFLESPLGIRMRSSERITRELPFSIELSAAEVYPELTGDIYEGETIMLQGVIDCYFEERGQYVLVDYKTDYATPEQLDELKERYRIQLEYYARAIQKITGKRVKSKYIYLFSVSMAVEYD